VTATFPLDLAKTRLQSSKNNEYKNLFQVLSQIKKTDGIGAWYRGYSINFGMIAFEKAIKLTFNDLFRFLLTKDGHISIPAQILAGGSAGFFQSVITTPMELLKIRFQVGEKNVISNVMKEGGIKAFYRGWISTLIRDIPFSCFYFPIYAGLKGVSPFGGGAWWNFMSGLLSGGFAGFLVTPFDVIKVNFLLNILDKIAIK
jgi:hypothetical protein